MKLTQISKFSGMTMMAIGLAVIPYSAGQAQVEEPGVAVVETEEDGFDWGLLGLLGLLGLAGLAGKNKGHDRHEVRGTEDFPTAPPTSRTDTTYR